MADLFLSYAPKDAEIAHKIAHSLESKGSSVFYDRRESADTNYLQHLDQEMSQASWIIVLWSRNALEDGRITYEAMHARDKNNLLSVQIEPNSIPTEYNNAQSADHVNYQNQLTLIIKQSLTPQPSTPVSPTPQSLTPQSEASESTDETSSTQQTVSTQTAQPQKTETPPQSEDTIQTADTANTIQQQAETSTNKQAHLVQTTGDASVTPDVPQNMARDIEQTPRQNLQKRLAETTQGSSAPAQPTTVSEHKIGQTPATNAVIRRDLPESPQKVANKASSTPIESASPVLAAANQGKTSKFVPVALMSIGTIMLTAVGGGYWYLANNSPASAIKKNYIILEPRKVEIKKQVIKPVQVAMVKIQKPQLIKPAVKIVAVKPTAPPKTDDILNSLLASSAPRRPATPPPAAAVPAAQKVAMKVPSLTSAQRGAKSISQCLGCHSFKKNEPNKSGPNLYGVMNQLIGSERKFNYSDTLRSMGAIGEVWSKDQLDCYLKNPAVCMPGTKMGFNGVKGHRKRNDIIAYLKTLKQ